MPQSPRSKEPPDAEDNLTPYAASRASPDARPLSPPRRLSLKACKAYQNKILFSLTAHPSGASVLPTRCTTDTSIETVLYNLRLAAHVRETLMTTAASASASDPACRRFFYGWVILAACFMVTTVASGTMMGFGVFITPMADDIVWSHSDLSFSYALYALVTGMGVLIVGSFLHTHSVRLIF